jgi:predicted secreted protein
VTSESSTPAQRAEAVLRAAEAAAAAAGATAPTAAAPSAGRDRDRLLALADELGERTAAAHRRLDELEAALDRLADAPR